MPAPHAAGDPAQLERVLRERAQATQRQPAREEEPPSLSHPIAGRSEPIRRLLDQIQRVASAPRTTVLISGESGTGKELVARAVHQLSRPNGPFVAVNCAALTESLLEAELFGYDPGAFTGGSPKGHPGLIASAAGGTLLLDEIAELALPLQAKLLRVLQERTYRRVGGCADLAMDARIVASTNRDLSAQVDAGLFREDLFYRLNVLSLRTPPLRERLDDLPLLARHFLTQFAAELDQPATTLSEVALERLRTHPWRGNVRELRNVLERAALFATGTPILLDHLDLVPSEPEPDQFSQGALPLGDRSLRALEKVLIRRVLQETDGNRSQAARLLGINRATLYNKIRALGLESSKPSLPARPPRAGGGRQGGVEAVKAMVA
jgi:transcriptional regulator with PAS, ATPase and Fis domain